MTLKNRPSVLLVVALAATVSSGRHDGAQAWAQAVAATPVELVSGTCAPVSEGDVLTLSWNPAFDAPSAVTGLQEFLLYFSTDAEIAARGHHEPTVILRATTGHTSDGPLENTIVTGQNGFYTFRFKAHVEGKIPGQYRLVRATAFPITTPGYQGPVPTMTNSPTSSSFCLEIISSTHGHR